MNQQRYHLSGLTCPVCAGKIEKKIAALQGVSSASFDLAHEMLTVESEAAAPIFSIPELQSLVDAIESGVTVKLPEPVRKAKTESEPAVKPAFLRTEQGSLIARIITAFALFAAGILLHQRAADASTALFIAAYLICGVDVILETVRSIRAGDWFNEAFLMALATVGALILGDFSEAAAVMIFYQTGEYLQSLAVARSRRSISDLMNIRPESANRLIPGSASRETEIVEPEVLEPGDEILIRPGERVPTDGVILSGSSSLDTAALTGESAPRDVTVDDPVQAGTINLNGVLTVRVTGRFAESAVMRILNLVENATTKKTKTERFITRFAKLYTPIVILAALLLAVLPPLLTGDPWTIWVRRSFVFLVTSCPCALVISIPLSYFAGIGKASANGILFKGTTYLESLKNADTIAFDKTGTLTQGIFTLAEILPAESVSAEDLLTWAAHAEADSTHPIAKSILSAYGKDIDRSRLADLREIAGQGRCLIFDGKTIHVGNERMMRNLGLSVEAPKNVGTLVFVAVENENKPRFAGTLVIGDNLKPDSAKALAELRDLGVRRTVLVTGDNLGTASAVASQLGIQNVEANLLPDQKVAVVESLIEKKDNRTASVVFVGDGINDAPVLARADIGIAMGGAGSEAAIEAADIVILKDEPSKIAEAIRIARRTDAIVRQNVIFALSGKAVFLILGATGLTGMWQAVFADVGIMLLAVLNAMRVLR